MSLSEEVTSENENWCFFCCSRGNSDAKILLEEGGYGFT